MKVWQLIVLQILITLVKHSEQTLQMIVEVARHGARAPYKQFPALSDLGEPGQLTLWGKQQNMNTGINLKDEYWFFIPSNYTEEKEAFYLRSTNYNRTIQSLKFQMYGYYEDKDIQYDIEVNQNKDELILLGDKPYNCPLQQKQYLEAVLESQDWKRELLSYYTSGAKQKLEKISGEPNLDYRSAGWLGDAANCYLDNKVDLPKKFNREWIYKSYQLYQFKTEYRYKTLDKVKTGSSNFFNKLIQLFKDRIYNRTSIKLVIMLGHEITLIPILKNLDMFEKIPPVGTSLIFELHKDDRKAKKRNEIKLSDYSVLMKINTINHQLPFCQYEDAQCPFNEFLDFIQNRIYKNTEEYLQVCYQGLINYDEVNFSEQKVISAVAALALFLVIITLKI